jgi:hypothetical protein
MNSSLIFKQKKQTRIPSSQENLFHSLLKESRPIAYYSTLTRIGGSVTATTIHDCIDLVCVTANMEFFITDSVGNITVI